MTEELGFSGIERLELVGGGMPGDVGPQGPVGPVGPQGPMLAPTYNGVQAITAATVTLKDVNEWTVAAPVQLSLPTVPAGAMHTIHVISGFHNITWPNGTEVFGHGAADEAWISLVRKEDHWNVLIPSASSTGGGGGLLTPIAVNRFPSPRLNAPSALIHAHVLHPALTGTPYTTHDFTGPDGCLKVVGSHSASAVWINLKNVTGDQTHQCRLEFNVLEVHDAADTFSKDFGKAYSGNTNGNPTPTAGKPNVYDNQALQSASKSQNLGKWHRSPPTLFTIIPGSAAPGVWVKYEIGKRTVAFRNFSLLNLEESLPLRDAFIPGVDEGAEWEGVENNSASGLYQIRPKDAKWISQWENKTFTSGSSALLDPEFADALCYPRASKVNGPVQLSRSNLDDFSVQHTSLTMPKPASITRWVDTSSGKFVTPFLGLLMGGTWMALGVAIPNFASTDWTVWNQTPGNGSAGIEAEVVGGLATFAAYNIAAAVANPTGVVVIFPENLRPQRTMTFPAMTNLGNLVFIQVSASTGEMKVRGDMALGEVLGNPGSAETGVVMTWRLQ